ncbi:winged helix-turn-helix domain-containing protein [Pseudoalteromonas denitrificans]|uniref:DNA-binding winged helix-turn-helix (WHTH) domain-containing protein n=1 Tax=Pseudoalteromonas denitrificans DSM 6059 TaxID=1123010 RepID=A0A1I1NU44_9GAMM|nr:winged helix-turn-helix domain-containing protein [Pseudoalteromonas denitrificans]SFC98263.1 DNA-binding winged helix-turn-helix (wHTH) domain-containing protein [Pseudoalteromonas denitrificans DSM 6059]
MPIELSNKVKLNDIEVDFAALKVQINEVWYGVEAKQILLLKLLIDNRGKALSRDKIMQEIWPEVIVSDNSVSQLITQLRKTLLDDKGTPTFIKTVPRFGYQLIAQVEVKRQTSVSSTNKSTLGLCLLTGLIIGLMLNKTWQLLSPDKSPKNKYQYQSRLTSVPGAEVFLRYSPDGRYLAFSQTDRNRSQMDLVVYDGKSKALHAIKNSGYSEQAPVWSPDGKWLAYYRHDPISCTIRVMSVINPVETWRLSPDFHMADCQAGFRRSKLHWPVASTLYSSEWHHGSPKLVEITLNEQGYPKELKRKLYEEFQPIEMDFNANKNMLIVQKSEQDFELSKVNLVDNSSVILLRSKQVFWGLNWDLEQTGFWIGNEALRHYPSSGEKRVIHEPSGFIADLDINPITGMIAHSEGTTSVNLYDLSVSPFKKHKTNSKVQLSSSARLDVLPAISDDGLQTAFVSYQRRSLNGFRYIEIWLKHKQKKAASVIANLPENITVDYLLWSPNGDNLLVADTDHNVYLINTFSKKLVPIISGFKGVEEIVWSKNGRKIHYMAKNEGSQWQNWLYDLQLANNHLEAKVISEGVNKQSDALLAIKKLNPSFSDYRAKIHTYLSAQIDDPYILNALPSSIHLYRPAITDVGIYYVLKQGHKLFLYLYLFDGQINQEISQIGVYEHDINVPLTVSSSKDAKNVVYSRVEGVEMDIVLHSKKTQ